MTKSIVTVLVKKKCLINNKVNKNTYNQEKDTMIH